MLVEKEVVRPGTYWYNDPQTGLPRTLTVTKDHVKYWHDEGNKMLSVGLTVPVPCEHDFDAHPMSPADKLKNNAGWVKEYKLKDDALFGVVDVQDPEVAKKLPGTIRWTSPWFNSFMDGNGREWKNVISHLALTTRPRIVNQQPFQSVAAALSMATKTQVTSAGAKGFCLSRAGLLKGGKPAYPVAFSLYGGVSLASEDKKKLPFQGDEGLDETAPNETTPDDAAAPMPDPLQDQGGDVGMEQVLCDLLGALGIQMPGGVTGDEFNRALYEAAMGKIRELTSGGQAPGQQPQKPPPNQQQSNPLIQQEQQPMYMSLDDINKLDEPLKSVALSMYNETVKANAKAAEAEKVLNSLRDGKLKEATAARQKRVALLSKLSPRAKGDLDAMLAMPSMALSLGDGGEVVDPMAATLSILEKGLADVPRLLVTDHTAMSIQAQPTDSDMLKEEEMDKLADSLARSMGCAPENKKAS